MELFFAILFMAIIVEGIVTYIKTIFVNGVFQWQIIVSIALGVFASVAYNVDLLSILGLSASIPFVGCVLTGILISRGSNYIFDLVGQITTIKTQKTQ